jgi:hypothetical protein
MQYCKVGGYYKFLNYPIWVVESTSHFTILIGDKASLNESQSNILLEQCRRAFKGVEGGEENGFIQAHQLRTVLLLLDIQLGESRIATLAASLKLNGAGIILWDDFWKAANQLLTGASLESLLQGDDTTTAVTTGGLDNAWLKTV